MIKKHRNTVMAMAFRSRVASLKPIMRTNGPAIARNSALNGTKMNKARSNAYLLENVFEIK